MPVKTCNNCHKNFTLGVDGVVDPKTEREICDQCAGVRRDPHGYAWFPGEIVDPFITLHAGKHNLKLRKS